MLIGQTQSQPTCSASLSPVGPIGATQRSKYAHKRHNDAVFGQSLAFPVCGPLGPNDTDLDKSGVLIVQTQSLPTFSANLSPVGPVGPRQRSEYARKRPNDAVFGQARGPLGPNDTYLDMSGLLIGQTRSPPTSSASSTPVGPIGPRQRSKYAPKRPNDAEF